jgi:Ankyrin repeat
VSARKPSFAALDIIQFVMVAIMLRSRTLCLTRARELVHCLQDGWTPLMHASSDGNDEIICHLLDARGIHVNAAAQVIEAKP